MIYIQQCGKRFFPNVFAPSALQGLLPSWSGILGRIVSPPRNVNHPIYGRYKITVLSRDEERRVAEHQFEKMIHQYPSGSYNKISIEDLPGK